MKLNRRQMLFAAGAAVFGAGSANRLLASQGPTKRVLFFTKSSGFQHSVVTRKGDALSHAERILTELGKQNGFEVVATKDGRLFDPDKIGQWDAFAFETTGVLTTVGDHKDGEPMSADGKKALLDAIYAGKGFIGMHCASDTFHTKDGSVDPYIAMLGGEFTSHGAQQEVTITIADADFPGAKEFGTSSFKIRDEWYAQKNLADDLHVIYIQNTEELLGPMYRRPNYPQTWARMHGKGRVFYTSMGHREDVWENPKYQGLLVAGLGFVTGKIDGNIESNVSKVTPGYKELPK
jgi:uncharacterized protein